MRCKACDKFLEDWELTRKDRETGDFLDLCTKCYNISEADLLDQDGVSFDDFITNYSIGTEEEDLDF